MSVKPQRDSNNVLVFRGAIDLAELEKLMAKASKSKKHRDRKKVLLALGLDAGLCDRVLRNSQAVGA